jgi:hypothetical protein
MLSVALRITDLPNVATATRKSLPFAQVEGTSVTIKSQLRGDPPLNDHLVWLWGILHHERRYLKALQTEGGKVTVHVTGARMPIEIKPNGAEMLHLLGATLALADT